MNIPYAQSTIRSFSRSLILLLLIIFCTSCNKEDQLEIQDNFPFEVQVLPVPKDIANGKTVEIRLTIQPSGLYQNTSYYLRYFQFDGQGTLQYYDEPPYVPNDLYPLPEKQFRLYYTSTSSVTQAFEIWIVDHFGNEKHLKFKFNTTN
ncbi:DUF3872 domain-containing protein [Flavobacterium sp. xlx-214]|uniref:DUF3872 domain-containing protein n=1 Tax=unclassified Flavobacterium TaxID=196869 RepID=UPI0013D3F46C|nr:MULTISPECIES: DUF3872 domain-containing protein [unclassified Flavobacterium]MBA5793481.1 DUF3872 domain-containing protein [Flavobacterium sp. xlx-221]QMI82748.1 DUF3872 domain-containing protein [Flavobacterium sp. xlx-214]